MLPWFTDVCMEIMICLFKNKHLSSDIPVTCGVDNGWVKFCLTLSFYYKKFIWGHILQYVQLSEMVVAHLVEWHLFCAAQNVDHFEIITTQVNLSFNIFI